MIRSPRQARGRVRKAGDECDRSPRHGNDHADDFAAVERFNSKRGADEHGGQGQSRERKRALRRGRVTKCQIEQMMKNAKYMITLSLLRPP